MKLSIYWIGSVKSGRIAIMPRPRGGDWLADEAASLRADGVDVVVSCLTHEECRELDLLDEATACAEAGIEFLSFPIVDRSVPTSFRETDAFLNVLENRLSNGKNVVVHCRAGIGRSSLLAACLLARRGMSVSDAFALITVKRGCSVPDTREQQQWVGRFVEFLRIPVLD